MHHMHGSPAPLDLDTMVACWSSLHLVPRQSIGWLFPPMLLGWRNSKSVVWMDMFCTIRGFYMGDLHGVAMRALSTTGLRISL